MRRLRPGGYLLVDERADGPEYRSDEVARFYAVHRQLVAPHAFSHASAAAIWGLRRWRAPERVHVIQQYRASKHAAADLARHFAVLPDDDVVARHGLPVTSLARTVVDCALTMHPLEGLVIADSALAGGLSREEAVAHLASRPSARGSRRGRLVLELADGGADSVWETWLRYVALRAGFPRPVTQYRVDTRLGPFYVDLAWPGHGVLAEFDGRIKYRDGAFGAGYDADEARFQEKRRADAIEEVTGVRLLRFTARDAEASVTARLRPHLPPTAPGPPPPMLPPPASASRVRSSGPSSAIRMTENGPDDRTRGAAAPSAAESGTAPGPRGR